MAKPLFFWIFLFSVTLSYAQKKDTTTYYMRNSGGLALNINVADFIRILYPPDSSITDRELIAVKDVFMNGKVKATAYTYRTTWDVQYGLNGPYLEYFPNGRRKYFRNYQNGKPIGEWLSYYSNGQLYTVVKYSDEYNARLVQCNDSTGKLMAENGNGRWIKYSDDLKRYISGNVVNGQEDGEWQGFVNDTTTCTNIFRNGNFLSGVIHYKNGKEFRFTEANIAPTYPAGNAVLGRTLASKIRYPEAARQSNTTGRVIVSFYVDENGHSSDIHVSRGIGSGCDEEAIRVVKTLPNKWTIGIQNGMPVASMLSIPIQFSQN
ncbi:energy transducer TonB [Mucilaginibacter pedocola]|uniref:TonB C-terminal domain-containing protein n=1 Tax=Mucilaginibacter pedocola TaxID=1792845 RepID=A0A1S9PLH6_9SPHI|nr:energy transducer TonB [Mucilaginibacter pedocola]OOQ61820.1 hypothetical protein BC343_01770 [Mucilaginibacter pedocola]